MCPSRNSRRLLVAVIGVIIVSTPIILMMASNLGPPQTEVKLTLLNIAGVMIEAKGLRIYIDPAYIPSNYSDFPADVILITHPHGDHYRESDIRDIETNDTFFVCPENMTDAVERHNGSGVNPGDSFHVGDITITAFYLYTVEPEGFLASHPREINSTSYIIDIDGFKIFHAGDAKYMAELTELTGTIDLAFLPIYWDTRLGPLNVSLQLTIEAIELLQPSYFIPTHFLEGVDETFISDYGTRIENSNCESLSLEYYESYTFLIDSNAS